MIIFVPFPSVLILAVQYQMAFGQAPPRAGLCGKTTEQVAYMPLKQWWQTVDNYRDKHRGESDDLYGDGPTKTYAACLELRNTRLAAKANPRLISRLRAQMLMFGDACIQLEDCLAGGGTYKIHEPPIMHYHAEKALYAVLTHAPKRALPADFIRQLRRYLNFYSSTTDTGANGERSTDLKRLHQSAQEASKAFESIESIMNSLDSRSRSHLLGFLGDYIAGYLSLRRSDRLSFRGFKSLRPDDP